jgi:hypothetical protein
VSSVAVAMTVFACAFGGALVGIILQRVLPKSHLTHESKDVIKLGTGLIATMAALVLGLLVGTAKSSFDAQTSGFQQMATNLILLDRALSHYGPEAKPAREQLRDTVSSMLERLWPASGSRSGGLDDATITADAGVLYDSIRNLSPQDDVQRSIQSQALQIGADLARNRWQLSQPDDGSLPIPFLAVLAFWLFVLFSSFGLFSPPNATVISVLLVCALSVAGAVYLIVDLDQPFEGLLQVSSASLRGALAQLGK